MHTLNALCVAAVKHGDLSALEAGLHAMHSSLATGCSTRQTLPVIAVNNAHMLEKGRAELTYRV